MSELTEFLMERVAEDEENADRYVAFYPNGDMAPLFHRVLAECAAKRAIVGMHQAVEDKGWQSGASHDFLWCASCGSLDDSPVPYPCDTLRAIANVYLKVGGADE